MTPIINLRERFGRRFKIVMEEGYTAQYGPSARTDDPHYQIIPGGRGHVYAWSATELAASTNTSGSTATKLKTLLGVILWQDGADGCTVLFPVDLLDQVADLLKLRRRRQVTEEERKRLAEIGRRHGFQPRHPTFQSDLEAERCIPKGHSIPEHPDHEAAAHGRLESKPRPGQRTSVLGQKGGPTL